MCWSISFHATWMPKWRFTSYYCVKWDILRPGCIELSQESQQHFPQSINRKQKQTSMTTIALLMKIVSFAPVANIVRHFPWIRAKLITASLQLLIFIVDNTSSIVLKQGGFSTEHSVEHVLEIEIADGGTPEKKSINPLPIKVCKCQPGRRIEYCMAYAQTGMSVSALLAILLCIVTILGMFTDISYLICFSSFCCKDILARPMTHSLFFGVF